MSRALQEAAAMESQAEQFVINCGILAKAIKQKCHVESRTETKQSWQLVDDAVKEGSMSSHVAASRFLPSASESSESVVADVSQISSKTFECPSPQTSHCKANVAEGTSGQTVLNNSVYKRSNSQNRVV